MWKRIKDKINYILWPPSMPKVYHGEERGRECAYDKDDPRYKKLRRREIIDGTLLSPAFWFVVVLIGLFVFDAIQVRLGLTPPIAIQQIP